MDEDNIRREHADAKEEWAGHFLDEYGNSGVEKLASGYREGQESKCQLTINGSYNLCFKVLFDDGVAWAVRFPIQGQVMYPEEKIRREVAIMEFIRHKTNIPVPRVIAFGTATDNHDPKIGPFLITEWIEGVPLSSIMEQLPRPIYGPVLRNDIDDKTIRIIYSQMAAILLDLSTHDFDKIGALGTEAMRWKIHSRPMTSKANDIESSGYIVVENHEASPFHNATEYMKELVRQNIQHLYEQRNSIDHAEDARYKYILRCQIKELVPYFSDYESGPFKLFCEDLRPGNVLIDKETFEIKAVIDWEWTYAAPRQFLFSPPPWLILERPSTWTGYGESCYQERLLTFLECLEREEEKRDIPRELSTQMRRYAEDGTFWIVQLLQDSFNFDAEIFRQKIKQILEKKNLGALGVPSSDEIERFVEMKLAELNHYNQDLQVLEDAEKAREQT